MAKDKDSKRDEGTREPDDMRQGSGEPDDREQEARGQFAGGNRGIQDDKSQGAEADRGQRGSQGGNKRGGSKG